MRSITTLLAIGAIAAAGSVMAQEKQPVSTDGTNPSTWKAEQEALKAAPGNHKVIFENADIRVLSVTVAPGETEPLHNHPWPSVMVIDSLTKLADYDAAGKEIKLPLPAKLEFPVIAKMPPQAAHRVKNLDTKPFHAIRIEFKKGYPTAP